MRKMIKIYGVLRRFTKKIKQDRVRAHAAEAAFFTILSFFPVLMLFLLFIQFTPINEEQIIYVLEEITPFEITEVLMLTVEGYPAHASALLSSTVIVALWAGGKGVMGLSDGLNAIYRIGQTKNYLAVRIRSACYVFVTLLSFLIGIGILVLGYRIQFLLRQVFPLLNAYKAPVLIFTILLAGVILILLFTFMYSFMPYKRLKILSQIPGAVFTTVAWTVFSYGFSIYLDFAENLTRIYGGLTVLAVAMLWLYFCMYLFFVGAEVNDYLAHPEMFC